MAKRHPRFWRTESTKPAHCELTVDESVTYNGQLCCLLKHSGTESTDQGGMVQTMGAVEYRGKRLCVSAKVKTQEVKGKSNLFVSVLDSQPAVLLHDAMIGREISGTNDWTELKIVIDVPDEARYINFGAMIQKGAGVLWIADLLVAEVSTDVPVTEKAEDLDKLNQGPTSFELAPTESDEQKPKSWRFHNNPASASHHFESGLREVDSRLSLWISSDAELSPAQGEKSSLDGTYTQTFNCFEWRNKRVRFSADIKCKNVGDWCGLMMWVRGVGRKTLAFTTMYNAGLSGDCDWQKCSVVLDVPPIASRIILGATLHGNGEVFFSNISFAEAGPDDSTTDRDSRPKNLSFAE